MKNPDFDLQDLSRLSICRNNDPMGFNCEDKDITFFISALVEELGEFAGAIKKLERGFNLREKRKLITKLKVTWYEKHPGQEEHYSELTDEELEQCWRSAHLKKFFSEGADIFIYLDLVMSLVQKEQGIQYDFFTAVRHKFNEVSKELNPQTTYIV